MKNNKKYTVFSNNLKKRRNELGYTQEALAEKINENGFKLTKSRIGRYETLEDGDSGFPMLYTAMFIAKELNCSLDWLCGLPDTGTLNTEHSSIESENVEVILLKVIAAILEDEFADLSIEDMVEDKPAIILENNMFEEFIDEYREAIDFEDSAKEKFGKDSPFANKATEFKDEILAKYIQQYAESKKSTKNVDTLTDHDIIDQQGDDSICFENNQQEV